MRYINTVINVREQCYSKLDPLTTSISIPLEMEHLVLAGYPGDSYELQVLETLF